MKLRKTEELCNKIGQIIFVLLFMRNVPEPHLFHRISAKHSESHFFYTLLCFLRSLCCRSGIKQQQQQKGHFSLNLLTKKLLDSDKGSCRFMVTVFWCPGLRKFRQWMAEWLQLSCDSSQCVLLVGKLSGMNRGWKLFITKALKHKPGV